MSYYDAFANLCQCAMQANVTPAPPATPTGSTWSFPSRLFAQSVVAVAIECQIVIDEDPGTSDHANRLLWAKRTLRDLLGIAPSYAYGIVQNATIVANGTSASSDSDVQAAAHALVPTWVGGITL